MTACVDNAIAAKTNAINFFEERFDNLLSIENIQATSSQTDDTPAGPRRRAPAMELSSLQPDTLPLPISRDD
jgi:hypothetical protein